MKELKFINPTGEEIIFRENPPVLMQEFNLTTEVNVYKFKESSADGERYISNSLSPCAIEINVGVEEADAYRYSSLKRKIQRVLNPKNGQGTLCYKDDFKELKITCIVEKINKFIDINDCVGHTMIYLLASYPYFKTIAEIKEAIALWRPCFEFQNGFMEFTTAGIEMEAREMSLIKNIINDGDAPSGITIEFISNGTVKNPAIYNLKSGKYFKVNKVMGSGERIIMTSHNGNIGIVDGIGKDMLSFWDPDSNFLELEIGENIFRYDADENINSLDVNISYEKLYLGVD